MWAQLPQTVLDTIIKSARARGDGSSAVAIIFVEREYPTVEIPPMDTPNPRDKRRSTLCVGGEQHPPNS